MKRLVRLALLQNRAECRIGRAAALLLCTAAGCGLETRLPPVDDAEVGAIDDAANHMDSTHVEDASRDATAFDTAQEQTLETGPAADGGADTAPSADTRTDVDSGPRDAAADVSTQDAPADVRTDTAADAPVEAMPRCGDGRKDPGEECDLGGSNSAGAYGLGLCTDQCKNAPYCGDGHKDPSEDCDLGASNSAGAYGPGLCTNLCKNAPYCGDGHKDSNEDCDLGASNSATAYGPGLCTNLCKNAPYCGDGHKDPVEDCDNGSSNMANAYGKNLCTNQCKNAPYCGDAIRNGPEACDNGGTGATDLGSCTPDCTGFYEKRYIKLTFLNYSTNLGGIAGADASCQSEFGSGYKALIVGGSRRATVTPNVGDGQLDWVLHKYTYYYNANGEFIWRTDDVALLGVHNNQRFDLYADAFVSSGDYPWCGFAADWTTLAESSNPPQGTCNGWTSSTGPGYGSFQTQGLQHDAVEICGAVGRLLCAQQ